MCILHSYCLQLALSVLYHSLQCKHSVFYVLYFPFCIEVEINAKDICVCFTSFSIVKCGQDCSRSVPLCHFANHTCAFVHHTTHLCVLCQHYMCFILLHSAMQCHYTLAPLQCFVAQCTAADTVLHWVRFTAHTLVTLFAWKLENVVQKCVSDLFKTYLCAVQFRVAMHCIVCGSAAPVSVHPPATALPRPPLLIHQILETAHRGYRRRNSQTI